MGYNRIQWDTKGYNRISTMGYTDEQYEYDTWKIGYMGNSTKSNSGYVWQNTQGYITMWACTWFFKVWIFSYIQFQSLLLVKKVSLG